MGNKMMKAWRVHGVNDMRLDDVPIPKARPGWLLARVKAFQPSITEIQRLWGISQRGLGAMGDKIQTTGPFCLGHEVCAVVEDIVDECELQKGDRITYLHQQAIICGKDYPGCFAEYYLLPINSAVKMDSMIPDIEGPALQPFSSCVRAVKEANVGIGETVAIFGQGVMGLNITQLCHLAGASLVIGLDVREQCLVKAHELGADVTINSSQEDIVQAISELTQGKGVDVAFECASGSPEVGLSGGKSFFNALEVIRMSGRLVQIAFFHDKITLDPNIQRFRNLKYIFPDEEHREDMDIGIHFVAQGKIKFKPYITHILQGIEKLPEAIDITAHKAKYKAINPAIVVVSQ
jgi:L-iditol 2-dehydrogenase